MLRGLFGSKSVEKILLFLLVNERCYATQLHRMLNSSLTPIQKALERLEREEILISRYEGKTRIFELNPTYPLLNELENLLKKVYTLLAPREKKQYYYVRHIPGFREKTKQVQLIDVWKQMRQVTFLTLEYRSGKQLKASGQGGVEADYDGDATLTYRERGAWKNGDQFNGIFRWTLNRTEGMLTLEHLRHGLNNPVFLFHLAPAGENHFESLHAHLCNEDTYFGHLHHENGSIQLTWRILGPNKNDELIYKYS